MNIISLAYGKFPAAAKLHSQFAADENYLKITLELEISEYQRDMVAIDIIDNLRAIFPRFDDHQCCHDEWSGFAAPVDTERTSNIRIGKVLDDTPHLLEHMLIETIATIGRYKSISGVTCGYRHPVNRYDIFVQCPDNQLGIFSMNFCMILMKKLIIGKKTIKLAGKFTDIQIEDFDCPDGRLPYGCRMLIEKLLVSPIPVIDTTEI